MAATYKILIMGASYGSLLASKLLFGGHNIKLVCLPAEADLINAEGFRVRLPVRGRKDAGRTRFAQAAGQGQRRRHRRRRSEGLRPRRSRHAGAAISLAGRARTARRGGAGQGALHVDHEHAAARLFAAHPGPGCRRAQARLYRLQRLGQLRSGLHHAVQPRPPGDPAAGGEGQRAAGDPADQLQGRALSFGPAHRDAAPAAGGDRGDPLRYAARARSSCR